MPFDEVVTGWVSASDAENCTPAQTPIYAPITTPLDDLNRQGRHDGIVPALTLAMMQRRFAQPQAMAGRPER